MTETTDLRQYCRCCRQVCSDVALEWEVGELLLWESDDLYCADCATKAAIHNMDKACGVIR